jgi:hypothetical protein
MSKGMDQKKTEKKKPEKSLKEKRAAKKEKKAGKCAGFFLGGLVIDFRS